MPSEPKNLPVAFHLCGMNATELPPSSGRAANLPSSLVIPPGRYRVHGKTYLLDPQGLYRFMLPGRDNQQRIVYRDDVPSLLSAVAWLSSHGARDNGKSHGELCRLAMTEKLIVTCGDVSQFALDLFTGLGVPARRVGGKTLRELNTYNNGHQLLEVWLDGRWALVDLDTKRMFVRRGRRLSLLEFRNVVPAGQFDFERISAAAPLAVGLFTVHGFDYGLWMEAAFSNDDALRAWYQRVMMVPIQHDENSWCTFSSPDERRRFERLYPDHGYRFLTPDEFRRRFYSKQ